MNNQLTPSDINKLERLMEDGQLGRLLNTITHTIALEIIGTEPSETTKREDLYNLTKALNAVEDKLQECVNKTITQGNYNVY